MGALVDDEVMASGERVAEVKRKAEQAGVERCVFYLVPSAPASLAPAIPSILANISLTLVGIRLTTYASIFI
jgi:hypothetical protein